MKVKLTCSSSDDNKSELQTTTAPAPAAVVGVGTVADKGQPASGLKQWIAELSPEYPNLDLPKVAEKWLKLCRERNYPLNRESFEKFLKIERPEAPRKAAKKAAKRKIVDYKSVDELDDEMYELLDAEARKLLEMPPRRDLYHCVDELCNWEQFGENGYKLIARVAMDCEYVCCEPGGSKWRGADFVPPTVTPEEEERAA